METFKKQTMRSHRMLKAQGEVKNLEEEDWEEEDTGEEGEEEEWEEEEW